MNLNNLLDYLHELSRVQGAGHFVNEEIKECIKAIRTELGFVEAKEKNVTDSKRMIFEAKLKERQGNLPKSFVQESLFRAVYSSNEYEVIIGLRPSQGMQIQTAIICLDEMKAPVKFELESEYVRITRK